MENQSFLKKVKVKCQDTYKKVDKALDKAFDATLKFFNKYQLYIVFTILFTASLFIRISLFEFVSGDNKDFGIPWVAHIREHGFIGTLKDNPPNYDYPIAYLLLLMPFSLLPVKDIVVIKIISVLFDYLLAFGGYLIVKKFTKNKLMPLLTAAIILFIPTVVLNSSVWGQCDQIFVSLIIISVYFLLKSKNKTAMFMLGLALSIKIQAVFFLPVLAILWLNKKLTVRQMLFMLLSIFLLFIPSLLVGSSFSSLLVKFFDLFSRYTDQNYGAANIYAFISSRQMEYALGTQLNKGANVIFAVCLLLFAIYMFYHKSIKITPLNLIYITTFFAIFAPFVMPRMHERYFFFADIMIVLYVIITKRRYFLAFLMLFSSLLAYTHYLTGSYIFLFLETDCVRLAAVMNFVIIIYLLKDFRLLERKKDDIQEKPHLEIQEVN